MDYTTNTNMPSDCWLYYNKKLAIKIDRQKVASSCRYFQVLLNGPYKEGRQTVINLHIADIVSYEAFSCLIRYANDGTFLADPDKLEVHIEAIQLCIILGYDKFKSVLEFHLMTQVCMNTLCDILGVALRHRQDLKRLIEYCENFEREVSVESFLLENTIPTCTLERHATRRHHYMNCAKTLRQEEMDMADYNVEPIDASDWTSFRTEKEVEEEKSRMVDLREASSRRLRGSEPANSYLSKWCNYLA